MKRIIIFLLVISFLSSCDPASTEETYNPDVYILSKIDLAGAETLAIAATEDKLDIEQEKSRDYGPSILLGTGNQKDCGELGSMNESAYAALEVHGNGQGPINPCFKNVGFWKNGAIFGQYTPDDSTVDVWFVTDVEGNVHHLKGEPRSDQGFKNGKRIRMFKDKPVFLNEYSQLTSLDMFEDSKEVVIEEPIKTYVILHRQDGEHLVYQESNKEGKRMRPGGATEDVTVIESAGFFYENGSADLGYNNGTYFKNMTFNEDGEVVEEAASGVPVALDEWVKAGAGAMPRGPVFMGSMQGCDKDENLIICEGKGFVVSDSSQDLKEIDWCDFGHCSQLESKSCLNDTDIYFYSANNTDPITQQLTKIPRGFNDGYSIVMNNIQISILECAADGGLLIKGRNTETYLDETFYFKDGVKTPLDSSLIDFIR